MKLLQIHEPGETPDPHEDTAAVGIDLGTTHSVVSMVVDGKPMALEAKDGVSLIPSAVDYEPDVTLVGHDALQAYWQGSPTAIASIKRLMGKSVAEALALFPEMAEKFANAEGAAVPRLQLGKATRTPVEISAEILKYLKTIAEEAVDREVTQAVITVPAYFDDAARTATRDAARLAGLEVLRILNEPTAAAVAYGLDNEAEGIYAIYDFGGGTFDVSLLRLEKGVFQVLATAGDTALGGDDIDRAIADKLAAQSEIYAKKSAVSRLSHARRIKEGLSAKDEVKLEEGVMTREQLNMLALPFVTRTLEIAESALKDADLARTDIKAVVLVGGSTRMKLVREEVEKFFGAKPHMELDPDRVVAYGAAVQAHQLTQGGDNLLLDVVPLSLGIETMGGIVEKLIHRNTPIPIQVSQEFTTYADNQQGMQFHVVQGEREMSEQCRSLARFELKGIPALPAGIARVRVDFNVDADGLLSVSAEELTTGTRQQVDVRPSYGLPPEEIERMLIESMENAREDITLRLLQETKIDAGRFVQEVKSALREDENLLETGEREIIDMAIQAVEEAAQGDQRDMIDATVLELQKQVAPFAERRMNSSIAEALKGKQVADF